MGRVFKNGSQLAGEYRSIVPGAKRGLRRIALGENREAAVDALRALETAIAKASGGVPVTAAELPLLIRDRFYEECRLGGQNLMIGEATVTPLSELLDAWVRNLTAKNRTAGYVEKSRYRVQRLLDACGFAYWAEISSEAIEEQLAQWREDERERMSIETSNHYVGRFKAFCTWCVKRRRIGVSPLADLSRLNARVDRRHQRRPLSMDELGWLLSITPLRKDLQGISGEDRAMVYEAAYRTGLRLNELRTLTARSLRIGVDGASITVLAGYSKHRREDVQPIDPDFGARLRIYLERRRPGERAFAMSIASEMARTLRRDLKAARAAWVHEPGISDNERALRMDDGDFLAYQNSDGKFADFHALRHTYITALAQSGVHPRTAQTLARHGTIALTMQHYTHTVMGDVQSALDSLPTPTPETRDQAKPLNETG
jgi:site-specific recombinase XerC